MDYDVFIGLEVHAQLSTKTKIWCGCELHNYAIENSKVCAVCGGHPGALPVMNKTVRDYAIKMGLATHCQIHHLSSFERKNYFYPDLPKGYQITQYETPICENGKISIILESGETKERLELSGFKLKRIRGNLFTNKGVSLLNLNRAGDSLIRDSGATGAQKWQGGGGLLEKNPWNSHLSWNFKRKYARGEFEVRCEYFPLP